MAAYSKPLPELSENDIRRFWSHVDKRGPDDCWLWVGPLTDKAYGKFFAYPSKRYLLAHRIGLFLHTSVDPHPLFACHACDVRYGITDRTYKRCCNGTHLFAGTQGDNQLDMKAKGRGTIGDRSTLHIHPETAARGEQNGMSRLTNEQVLAIRSLHLNGMSQTAIAPLFGITQTTVSTIVLHKTWRHVA